MSAFQCSDDHIMILAIAATRGASDRAIRTLLTDVGTPDDVRERNAMTTLATANQASLAARYGDEMIDSGPFVLDAQTVIRLAPHITNPVHVLKLAQCFAYQSCEYDGWESSSAAALVRQAIGNAIPQLAGYEAAPWGV